MDKRYDAIYQRGHGGAPSAGAPGEAPAQNSAPSEHPPSGAPPASGAPGRMESPGRQDAAASAEGAGAAGRAGRAAEPVTVAHLTADGRPAPAEHPASAPAAPRRNPYLGLLIAVGCILTAGGAVALYWGGRLLSNRMMPSSAAEQDDIFLMITYGQSLTTLGPFLMVLGLGTLIGVTFLTAANWRATHRP